MYKRQLYGVPESVVAAVSVYDMVARACDAAIAAMQTGLCLSLIHISEPTRPY